MSKQLMKDEKPIMVMPKLAVKIGLYEAMVLQQVHYWLVTNPIEIEGRRWCFNSIPDWQKQLPFLSESTVKRVIKHLEEMGYLLSGNFNRMKFDRTKWYTIDYAKLAQLAPIDDSLYDQLPPDYEPAQPEDEGSVNLPLLKSYSKSPSESSSKNKQNKKAIPYSVIIDYLNQKAATHYKQSSKKTRALIHARWIEGYVLADFIKVIDPRTQRVPKYVSKGNCLDNSPMENFFGLLKQEMYYGEPFVPMKN